MWLVHRGIFSLKPYGLTGFYDYDYGIIKHRIMKDLIKYLKCKVQSAKCKVQRRYVLFKTPSISFSTH